MIVTLAVLWAVCAGLLFFAACDYLADRRYLKALSKAGDLLIHRHAS